MLRFHKLENFTHVSMFMCLFVNNFAVKLAFVLSVLKSVSDCVRDKSMCQFHPHSFYHSFITLTLYS